MPDLNIDFTWFQDVKGYRLIPAKPLKLRPGQSILDAKASDIQPARIVRNGGKLQPYRPFELHGALFETFISAAARNPTPKSDEDRALAPMTNSEDGLLKFVERFGPLTYEGLKGQGDRVPNLIDAAETMLQVRRGRIFGKFLGKLDTTIIADHSGVRLKHTPPDLLSALWLELVQAKDKGPPPECKQCGKSVLGRRADARFCSDDCRIKYNNSLRRIR